MKEKEIVEERIIESGDESRKKALPVERTIGAPGRVEENVTFVMEEANEARLGRPAALEAGETVKGVRTKSGGRGETMTVDRSAETIGMIAVRCAEMTGVPCEEMIEVSREFVENKLW